MTVVLTLLIWAAADSLVNETVSVPVRFRPLPSGGRSDIIVSPTSAAGVFQLQVSGPRKSVARIQEQPALEIRLAIPELPTGTSSIPLKETLREQWRDYPKVFVVSVQPPQLSVMVDRMITREMPLTAERLTLPYDDRPRVQPPAVQARVRESLFHQNFPPGQLPPLDISAEAERLLKEQSVGQSVTVRVPLDARALGPDASLSPNFVEVRATVTATRTTAEIATVPILVAVSPGNLGKQLQVLSRDGSELVTQTIKVTGPTEEVNRLSRGETRAYGVIQLKDEHLAELDVFKPFTPEFQLPPALELAVKPKPIELKLVDPTRSSKAEPPGPTP